MNLDKTDSWTANPYKVGVLAILAVALVYVLLFKYLDTDKKVESAKSLSMQVLEACIITNDPIFMSLTILFLIWYYSASITDIS